MNDSSLTAHVSKSPDVVRVVTVRPKLTPNLTDSLPMASVAEDEKANVEKLSPDDDIDEAKSVIPDDPLISLKDNKFMNPAIPLKELICESTYLEQYPSWLGFCGTENKKKFSPTYIARNDVIWELIFTERGYVDLLITIRDVYMIPFPTVNLSQFHNLETQDLFGSDIRTALFPSLEELISAHERILRPLLALHSEQKDRVIKSLGPCLVKLFDKGSQASLSQLYGHFLFVQKRIRQRLQILRNYPPIATFLQQAKLDSRGSRKSLEDCYMVIVQRWTKVESLLDAIIKNTLNQPFEVEQLKLARNSVRTLLKQAESILTELIHAEKLREIQNHLQINHNSPNERNEVKLMNELRSPTTKLINYGSLIITSKSSIQHDVIGVALNTCFFMLKKPPDSVFYQLLNIPNGPSILWWGQDHGYFRRAVEKKGSFGFFLLLQSSLTLCHCGTIDEVTRWETVFNNGFSQWQELHVSYDSLNRGFEERNKEIEGCWERVQMILELLQEVEKNLQKELIAHKFIFDNLIHERLIELNSSSVLPITDNSGISYETSESLGNFNIKSQMNLFEQLMLNGPSGAETNNISNNYLSVHPNRTSTSTAPSPADITSRSISDSKIRELDQLMIMFKECLVRLSFALIGGSSSGLSRSASDVERKQSHTTSIRKNETFSVRDNRTETGDGNYKYDSKKRDHHRISAIMTNLFRTGSRDKSTSASLLQPSWDGSSSSSTPSSKIPSNLGDTSRSNQLPINASPLPSRPVSGLEHSVSSVDSACSSFAPQSSEEILILLRELNDIFGKLPPVLYDFRMDILYLNATLVNLKAKVANLEEFHDKIKQNEGKLTASGGSGRNSDGADAYIIKQETEKLRQDYENFTRKCQDWEKDYQHQRDAIEREHNKLAKERQQLEDARIELERWANSCREYRITAQKQMDYYKQMGVDFSTTTLPEFQLPDILNKPNTQPLTPRRPSTSSLQEGSYVDWAKSSQKSERSSIHFHSNSDDMSNKFAHSFIRDSSARLELDDLYKMEAGDVSSRSTLTPSGSIRNDQVPFQLSGSLVNQRSWRDQPITSSSTQLINDKSARHSISSPHRSLSTASSTDTTTSSPMDPNILMKLADSKHGKSLSSRHKKSSRLRVHKKDS